jgi:hypothetical protein
MHLKGVQEMANENFITRKAVVGITAGSSRNNVNNDQLPKYL